jgi:predicted metal-dependent hydrolase
MQAILKTIFSKPTTPLVFEGGGHRRELAIVRMVSARTMRLAIDPRRGAVRLTLPRRANVGDALRWAESKRGWIETELARIPVATTLGRDALVPYRGVDHRIDWSASYKRRPEIVGATIRLGGPEAAMETRLLRWLRDEARQILTAETRDYAAIAGVDVGRVSIGDPVSRWGSCSASGDIRYSWRLILAPDFVRRATVAHEVAHRLHMDHSPAFHACVAALFGQDPKPARTWLRQEGAGLHRFGV